MIAAIDGQNTRGTFRYLRHAWTATASVAKPTNNAKSLWPYSINVAAFCKDSAPGTICPLQVGQSVPQPNPDPDTRVTAPITIIANVSHVAPCANRPKARSVMGSRNPSARSILFPRYTTLNCTEIRIVTQLVLFSAIFLELEDKISKFSVRAKSLMRHFPSPGSRRGAG